MANQQAALLRPRARETRLRTPAEGHPDNQMKPAGKSRADSVTHPPTIKIECLRMPVLDDGNHQQVTITKARRMHQYGNAACGRCHNRSTCATA